MGDTGERESAAVDRLYAQLLSVGESRPRARELLAQPLEEQMLVALLRRALPSAFLEELAATRPWSERPRVLARVVLNPRAPQALSLRLVGSLYWRDLAEVAGTARVNASVRVRAESLLRDTLPEMRLGDKVTLARLATAALLGPLLADPDPHVVEAALTNPRLREEDLVSALRRQDVRRTLVEGAAGSPRWSISYAVRLALATQSRTPLAVALQQISSLLPRDLVRISDDAALHPLVRSAARSLLERERPDG